jgi:hypothetical protein
MMKRVMSHPRLGQRYISYIPAHETVIDSDLDKLHDMIDHASKVVVLTGAGVSTEVLFLIIGRKVLVSTLVPTTARSSSRIS